MPTLAAIEEHFEEFKRCHLDVKDRKAAASRTSVKGGSAFPDTTSVFRDKRRLFLLEQGQFGIGHQDVEFGDQVCIVPDGWRMPLILRGVEGRDGYCQLMGEAFVDGIMYDEALGLMEERDETWEQVWIVWGEDWPLTMLCVYLRGKDMTGTSVSFPRGYTETTVDKKHKFCVVSMLRCMRLRGGTSTVS